MHVMVDFMFPKFNVKRVPHLLKRGLDQVGGKHVAVEHNKRKMKVNCAVLKNEPENIRHAYM